MIAQLANWTAAISQGETRFQMVRHDLGLGWGWGGGGVGVGWGWGGGGVGVGCGAGWGGVGWVGGWLSVQVVNLGRLLGDP